MFYQLSIENYLVDSTTSTVILAYSDQDKYYNWKTMVNDKSLIEHAIDRSKILSGKIYIMVDSPSTKEEIISVLPKLEEFEFLIHDTSITSADLHLKSVQTILRSLNDNYVIIHSIDYPLLNSLDLLRLQQYLKEKPLELVTYQHSENKTLMMDVVGMNIRLTQTRKNSFFNLKDQRYSSFFRSSLNTGIVPISSDRIQKMDELSSFDNLEEDGNSKPLEIIRPAKYYQAFIKLKKKKIIDEIKLRSFLEEENKLWKNIEPIVSDNKADEKRYL